MFKLKLTPLCIAICLSGGMVSSAFADTDDAKVDQLIKKVNARTAELEKELRSLRAQVAELKKENKKQEKSIKQVVAQKNAPRAPSEEILKLGIMPVVTAPFISDTSEGLDLEPNGLTIVLPSYNLDLGLLKQRQQMDKAFAASGRKPTRGLLEISGRVEAQAYGVRNTDSSRSSDINVSDVEVDLTSRVGEWMTAFVAMKFDGSSAPGVTRVSNSRLFVNQGFLVIGNLDKSPVYGSIGQRYVQFGQYSNPFVTGPFTRTLGRIKARQISVSYQHPADAGVYATLFTFRGDSRASQNINQLGGSLGYSMKQAKWSTNVGVDYVTNIADGEGAFQPAFSATNQLLVNRVPGIAVHGRLDVAPFTLLAEYIGSTTTFNPANLMVNGTGAKPQALHVAGMYSFKGLWGRPSDIAIGYNRARDTQALGIPQSRISLVHNIVILKNTIFSLEFRRDQNYSASDTATVQGLVLTNPTPAIGGYTNTLTAQISYLF